MTTMRAIGHQQLSTDNNITNKDRHVVYVKSSIKKSQAKEK